MRKYLLCSVFAVLTLAAALSAWWVQGHGTIAEAAVSRMPDDVPAFFRAGGKHLGHLAGDPDRWKNPKALHLRAAEYADHFLDLEDLEGNALPEDQYKAARLIVKLNKLPERVGMLPYAIMEHYDRLKLREFKDHRDDPKNETVRMKCLVYAGVLSHYTGDCAMPLHTTRDYDGRKGSDEKIVQKGIHAKIDAFPEKFGLTAEEIGRGLEPKQIDNMWAHVLKEIQESHKHVERCYELDKVGAFDKPTAESRAFILDRCRVAAQFTMDVWYTAWVRSAKMPKHY